MKLAIAKLPEFWRGITRNRDIERSAREWMEGYDAALAYCAEQLDQALSHAAGQDGEQCRAASVDSGRLASKLEDVRDGIADVLPIVYLETIDDAIEALRALSRGVPEGNQAAVDSVIRQYCRTCGGCGEIGGHSGQTPESYEEWSAPCPDCSPAAIAAQRKEG